MTVYMVYRHDPFDFQDLYLVGVYEDIQKAKDRINTKHGKLINVYDYRFKGRKHKMVKVGSVEYYKMRYKREKNEQKYIDLVLDLKHGCEKQLYVIEIHETR